MGGYRELNPDRELHKLACYRYTIATIGPIITQKMTFSKYFNLQKNSSDQTDQGVHTWIKKQNPDGVGTEARIQTHPKHNGPSPLGGLKEGHDH